MFSFFLMLLCVLIILLIFFISVLFSSCLCGIIPKDAKKENEEIGITATKLLKR